MVNNKGWKKESARHSLAAKGISTSYDEKSHVGMLMCPICRKEATSILIDKKLRNILPRETIGIEPCEKCKKKYLKEGILLINPNSGSLVVIKESAFKRIFNKPIPPQRIAFAEEEVLKVFTKGEKK